MRETITDALIRVEPRAFYGREENKGEEDHDNREARLLRAEAQRASLAYQQAAVPAGAKDCKDDRREDHTCRDCSIVKQPPRYEQRRRTGRRQEFREDETNAGGQDRDERERKKVFADGPVTREERVEQRKPIRRLFIAAYLLDDP